MLLETTPGPGSLQKLPVTVSTEALHLGGCCGTEHVDPARKPQAALELCLLDGLLSCPFVLMQRGVGACFTRCFPAVTPPWHESRGLDRGGWAWVLLGGSLLDHPPRCVGGLPRGLCGECTCFQEAIFNKNTGKVVLKTFSLYRKLLTLLRAGHDQGEVWESAGLESTWVRAYLSVSWGPPAMPWPTGRPCVLGFLGFQGLACWGGWLPLSGSSQVSLGSGGRS